MAKPSLRKRKACAELTCSHRRCAHGRPHCPACQSSSGPSRTCPACGGATTKADGEVCQSCAKACIEALRLF